MTIIQFKRMPSDVRRSRARCDLYRHTHAVLSHEVQTDDHRINVYLPAALDRAMEADPMFVDADAGLVG